MASFIFLIKIPSRKIIQQRRCWLPCRRWRLERYYPRRPPRPQTNAISLQTLSFLFLTQLRTPFGLAFRGESVIDTDFQLMALEGRLAKNFSLHSICMDCFYFIQSHYLMKYQYHKDQYVLAEFYLSVSGGILKFLECQ